MHEEELDADELVRKATDVILSQVKLDFYFFARLKHSIPNVRIGEYLGLRNAKDVRYCRPCFARFIGYQPSQSKRLVSCFKLSHERL